MPPDPFVRTPWHELAHSAPIHRQAHRLAPPPLDLDAGAWSQAHTARIDAFRPESSDHRPVTLVRLLHSGRALHGLFDVTDRYVRCTRARFNDMVCKDSCVEFFVKPRANCGYINFEFSAIGTLHASFITDPTRTPDGFKQFVRLSPEDARMVTVSHTLDGPIDPELAQPVQWRLGFTIDIFLLERYIGPLGDVSSQVWRANFYKCGDETSRPHWAAWSPVPRLNFHDPDAFGELAFE